MKCTQCQKENPIDTLFCSGCGANQNTKIEVKEFQPIVEIYRESSMVGFLFNYKILIDGNVHFYQNPILCTFVCDNVKPVLYII